ncbi:methyltransferase family protein [Methylibium rhizosphaerae]|uniref:methyltransferase family protein n=1 Tax=Methylibium rhizosphaerae TaxID=2570323 RepID=UPI00112CA475|nr:isoprenylcysteine carboxylmethyltransferase family protein [Methylibium rhizosphaerae]
MNALELKVPPPVVALVVALLMWGCAQLTPPLDVPPVYRLCVALVLFAAGLVLRLAAQLSFRKAGTTVNPLDPSRSSAFVSRGVYRFSRNPMYLGRVLQLLGWAAFLANAAAVLLVPLYVLYVTRFQILPEERMLTEQFGGDYLRYTHTVRRWL